MQLDASVINSGFPCQSRVAFIGPFFPFEMKKNNKWTRVQRAGMVRCVYISPVRIACYRRGEVGVFHSKRTVVISCRMRESRKRAAVLRLVTRMVLLDHNSADLPAITNKIPPLCA